MPTPISAPIQSPNLSQKGAKLDIKASEPNKTVERKKYAQVVNVLKESIGATTITKRILELKVI